MGIAESDALAAPLVDDRLFSRHGYVAFAGPIGNACEDRAFGYRKKDVIEIGESRQSFLDYWFSLSGFRWWNFPMRIWLGGWNPWWFGRR